MKIVKTLLQRSESPFLDRISLRIARAVFRATGNLPSNLRSALLCLWSTDPLRRQKRLPTIDLAIVFALKDVELVPAAVFGAINSSSNPIDVVRLVTPSLDFPEVVKSIEVVRRASFLLNFSLEVYDDASLLGADRLKQLESHQVRDRSVAWVTQQLLKLSAVLKSAHRATLIVDADTILLRRRTWLARDGRQLIMCPEWFRDLWTQDVEDFLRIRKTIPFSFITHHQLMQRELVEQLFGAEGEKLLEWALNARRRLAEYETYGTYLAELYPHRAVFARFGNVEDSARPLVASVENEERLCDIAKQYGLHCLSLSVHHYL